MTLRLHGIQRSRRSARIMLAEPFVDIKANGQVLPLVYLQPEDFPAPQVHVVQPTSDVAVPYEIHLRNRTKLGLVFVIFVDGHWADGFTIPPGESAVSSGWQIGVRQTDTNWVWEYKTYKFAKPTVIDGNKSFFKESPAQGSIRVSVHEAVGAYPMEEWHANGGNETLHVIAESDKQRKGKNFLFRGFTADTAEVRDIDGPDHYTTAGRLLKETLVYYDTDVSLMLRGVPPEELHDCNVLIHKGRVAMQKDHIARRLPANRQSHKRDFKETCDLTHDDEEVWVRRSCAKAHDDAHVVENVL